MSYVTALAPNVNISIDKSLPEWQQNIASNANVVGNGTVALGSGTPSTAVPVSTYTPLWLAILAVVVAALIIWILLK
jgi:hypothetical protein